MVPPEDECADLCEVEGPAASDHRKHRGAKDFYLAQNLLQA